MSAPPGLYIIKDWVSVEEEQELVDFLSAGKWVVGASETRPVQNFGYSYGEGKDRYSSFGKITTEWGPIRKLADKLELQHPGVKLTQALVNLYYKDSQIGSHRDKESPVVVFGVSLVSDINMDWTSVKNTKDKRRILIPRRSLYMMTGDSVRIWKHSVPALKRVYYPDKDEYLVKPDWYIRVSITLRDFSHIAK